MLVFEKLPRLRIVFLLGYVLFLIVSYFQSGSWDFMIILLPVFLMTGYITLAKANVVLSPRAEVIDNFRFDLLNVSILIYSTVKTGSYFLQR